MTASPEYTANVMDRATPAPATEIPRCVCCGNRTGIAGAVWLGSHGLWCLRCFSNHLVELL